MRKNLSPAAVGAFVLGAVAVAIIFVLVVGSGRLFSGNERYVAYFKGDVNGLHVGAPVKFKGVEVGSVVDIKLVLSNVESKSPSEFQVPVLLELGPRTVIGRPGRYANLNRPDTINYLIGKGLRAQLATESLVTGLLYVSLDMRPETRANFVMRGQSESEYVEIPTVPTALEQVQQLAMRALTKIGQIDVDNLIKSTTTAVNATSKLLSSPALEQAVEELPATISRLNAAAASLQKLADNTNVRVTAIAASLRTTSANATQALQQTQATLQAVRETVAPGSPLAYQLGQTLADVSDAARAMRNLAEYLDRNPSAVVRGRDTEAGK
jgi:paraquat-inducible protein B